MLKEEIVEDNEIIEEAFKEYIKLKNALNKACNELVKMCRQTDCKNCHFVKEQVNCDNDCPVQGNSTFYDWKKWSFEDESN